MVRIRRATAEDLDTIINLWLALASYHEKLDSAYKLSSRATSFYRTLASDLLMRGLVLVAEEDRRIVGFLTAEIFYNPTFVPSLQGRILDIYVEENYRRRGIGSQLVKEALKWFQANGVQCVLVNVAEQNKVALNFWSKMRFRVLSRKMILNL
ncbi:MAG: GNAT family N-acetyltransferase [Candidatus Baldrarchaeia archaeon]